MNLGHIGKLNCLCRPCLLRRASVIAHHHTPKLILRCHRVFYVRQDWNAHAVVRSQENTCVITKRRSWNAFYIRQNWNVHTVVRSQENTRTTTKRCSWNAGACRDALWRHVHSQSGMKFKIVSWWGWFSAHLNHAISENNTQCPPTVHLNLLRSTICCTRGTYKDKTCYVFACVILYYVY